jgi:membrane protein DedA with SNARE-associated domain
MAAFITAITPFVEAYGAIGVGLVAFLEEIIAPIPSLFSLMAAGFFLIPQQSAALVVVWKCLAYVALPAGIGLTAGAFLVYSALYFGGEPVVRRWGRWVGLSWDKVKRAEEHLIKGTADEWILFGLRVVPFVPNVAVSAVCGLFKYPLKTFLILTFLGGAMRAFLMGLVGWALGAAYAEYANDLTRIGSIAAWVFLGVAAVAIGLWIHRMRKKRHG